MKKLMTAVAVALLAIATNAATYNWNAQSYWVTADGLNPLEVMVYAFDATAYSLATITAALDSGDTSVLGNALGSAIATDEGFMITDAGVTDDGGDPKYAHMYAILLDTQDASTAAHYYASTVIDTQITDAVIAGQADFIWDMIETGATSSWASIGGSPTPEPTSGLLLLLGLSGLALRRRRA